MDIFLELEAWTEIIQCYRRIGQTKRAEIIVRERLEQEETPELWCSRISSDLLMYEQGEPWRNLGR